ncbi:MAG: hypothetical protein LBR23_03275 [Spirochaetaceae bacterium]|nr:hypothetical protein [Spirochaetaceae bacterium]
MRCIGRKRYYSIIVLALGVFLLASVLIPGCDGPHTLREYLEARSKKKKKAATPPEPPAEVIDLAPGGIDSAGVSGRGWSYDSGTKIITIKNGANVIFMGATEENRVAVAPGAGVKVTLAGASIDMSGTPDVCAFDLGNGAAVTLLLSGTNTLRSNGTAGLHVPSGRTLWIGSAGTGSSGTLTAQGGQYAAGIGGGSGESGGTITVSGGTVTAQGGQRAAGIGGGWKGNGGIIAVSGGTVSAQGGTNPSDEPASVKAAAIGGGWGGNGGTITLSGGEVIALGGIRSAMPVGGTESIKIKGGTVIAEDIGSSGLQGDFSGNAVVFVSSVPAGFSQENHADLVVCGAEASIGDATITLNAPLTIPGGVTLRVPGGWTLNTGGLLTNNGTVANNGRIIGNVAGIITSPLEICYHLNGGALHGIGGDSIREWTQTAQPYTLPTPVFEDNRPFLGWYGNGGLTGAPVTELPADTTGIREFWAKWGETPAVNVGSPGQPQ